MLSLVNSLVGQVYLTLTEHRRTTMCMLGKGIFFLVLLLLISVGINVYFFLGKEPLQMAKDADINELHTKYPYLSQKVLTENNRDILINFYDLRQQLDTMVKPYENSFGLFFEYLPTGTSLRINDDAEFYAASLVKVPIVMAYYHQKNRLKQEGDEEVIIEERDLNDKYGDLWKRGAGTKIKMSEAIRLALEESDNTAGDIILHRISEEDFMKVYEGLDIELRVENEETIITAEQYSSVLKALYYSSVLPIEDSNQILASLTRSKFQDKIPAGVPGNVPVAHKVGILGETLYQDCGIVYLPRRPYLLCMISQSSEVEATARMSAVSKIIYHFVSTANPTR